MFTVLACADLQGGKVNLEVSFPAIPSLTDLTRQVEDVFTGEVRALGATGVAADFKISKMQIYDDVFLKWVDLVSSTQLHEYDQIYVFQPQTYWHVDTQQDLPAPRQPTTNAVAPAARASFPGVAAAAAPQPPAGAVYPPPSTAGTGGVGVAAIADRGGDAPFQEKVSTTFKDLDARHQGFLEYPEFERSLRERGLDFSSNTLSELFYKADLDRDGRVTYDEWANWCQIYPNTLETLFYRSKDTAEESQLRREIQRAQDQIAANRARVESLQREIEQNQSADASMQSKIGTLQQQATIAAQNRQKVTHDERELIEEEIKLERQRDQMRLQQQRFQEVSDRFNRGAQTKGSPRRARDVPA